MAEMRLTMAQRLVSVLSLRIAIRLNSLSLQKNSRSSAAIYKRAGQCPKGPCVEAFVTDDDLGSPLVQVRYQPVRIERLVGDQTVEFHVFEWSNTHHIVTLTGQQDKTHQIAQRIRQCQDFGRHTASGFAYGLILSPPFAPWP